jgi:hypothetical protein
VAKSRVAFGVDDGQAYWYGRPATVEAITAEAAGTLGPS